MMKPRKQGRKGGKRRGGFYLFICEGEGVMGGCWFVLFP